MEEKILVIDDEKGFVLLVKYILKRDGYTVITAYDGEEGLEKAKKEKPDLIICDINMPKKNGYEVLQGIRREVDKNVPFIMLTMVDEFRKVEEVYEYDATFYIAKPVEFAILLRSVRVLLDVEKNRRASQEGQDERPQG